MSNYYLKAKKKKKHTNKHTKTFKLKTLLASNLCLHEKRAQISLTLLLSPLKNEKNQDNCNRFIRLKAISSSSDNPKWRGFYLR